jgi:hypothetical protein
MEEIPDEAFGRWRAAILDSLASPERELVFWLFNGSVATTVTCWLPMVGEKVYASILRGDSQVRDIFETVSQTSSRIGNRSAIC